MLSWFIGLPLAVQILIGVLTLICVVILAFIGKFNIQMGGPRISFGRSDKRNCGDCILLMMSKRERYEVSRDRLMNGILKDQMNVAEQKLLAVKSLLLSSYRDTLRDRRHGDPNVDEENKQYRLYQGVLGNALMSVKDEIRRSFKENGFVCLSGTDFSLYVKDKVATLTAIGRDHVIDLYPYSGMTVTVEDRIKNLERIAPALEDICFEMFQKAKDIEKDALRQLNKLNNEFKDELNDFVEERK